MDGITAEMAKSQLLRILVVVIPKVTVDTVVISLYDMGANVTDSQVKSTEAIAFASCRSFVLPLLRELFSQAVGLIPWH